MEGGIFQKKLLIEFLMQINGKSFSCSNSALAEYKNAATIEIP
jgi:hypothetical protein